MSFDNIIVFRDTKTIPETEYTQVFLQLLPNLKPIFQPFKIEFVAKTSKVRKIMKVSSTDPFLEKSGGIFFCPTAAYLFISIAPYMLYEKVSSERNT